jgi:hypothetical protein
MSSTPIPTFDAFPTPVRKKPGRKTRQIQDRVYRVQKPVLRKEESHSKVRRLAVVMFLYYHKIYDPDHRKSINGYRQPTQKEAAIYFKVPQRTISDWWCRDLVSIESKKRSYTPHWPQLEQQLFQDFIQLRIQGRPVSTAWFRKRAKDIFRQSVSSDEQAKLFSFSNGWWAGFRKRFSIVARRVTKRATLQPEAYREVCGSFCKFIKRVQHGRQISPLRPLQLSKMEIESVLESPRRRFIPRHICNVDETPIPYIIDSGSTWALRGDKTVSVKSARSGWEKRQATVILYIFGDGSFPLGPTIIFKGSSTEKARIFDDEGDQYAPGIKVIYNEHAYNNEVLFREWIKDDLATVKDKFRDLLLVIDAAAFHLTEPVKEEVKEQLITTALIPAGCTSLLQPLDTTVNKLFKQYYREEMDIYELEAARNGKTEWTVSERRIMTTIIVKKAWDRVKRHPEMIRESFLRAGITTSPTGRQDHLISIKGVENIDLTGWETAEEISVKSEELVSRLCDDEELFFGPAEDFNEDILTYTLKGMKMPQLKDLAGRNEISTIGKKSDIIERLKSHFLRSGTVEDSITVQFDVSGVPFDVL